MAKEIPRRTIYLLHHTDSRKYRKGKKLLKVIRTSHSQQRSTSIVFSQQLHHGQEADIEPEHPSVSSRSGTIEKVILGHQSCHPQSRSGDAPCQESGSGEIATIRSTLDPQTSPSAQFTTRFLFKTALQARDGTLSNVDQESLKHTRTLHPTPNQTIRSLERTTAKDINELEFSDPELGFLNWLNGEMDKVDTFYNEKEIEAAKSYRVLSIQLEALHRLRGNQQIWESNVSSPSPSSPGNSSGHRIECIAWVKKHLVWLRAWMDGVSSVLPAADHHYRIQQPGFTTHPNMTTGGFTEYRIARRRLENAMLEFYREMELLKSYRLLNRTGFTKILKKFDKTSGRSISGAYAARLKQVNSNQSVALENTMNRTEVSSSVPSSDIRICMLCTLNERMDRMLWSCCSQAINGLNVSRLSSSPASFWVSRSHFSLREL